MHNYIVLSNGWLQKYCETLSFSIPAHVIFLLYFDTERWEIQQLLVSKNFSFSVVNLPPVYHTHHCDSTQYCNVKYSSQASNTARFSILVLSSAFAGAAVNLPPRCSLPAHSQSEHDANSVHNCQAKSTSKHPAVFKIQLHPMSTRESTPEPGRKGRPSSSSCTVQQPVVSSRYTGRISNVPAAQTTHAA